MDRSNNETLAWPEPPPPLPKGLTREIFITLPLYFTLNRSVMNAMVAKGRLSQEDADRLIQEDEYRKAINAVLDYFNYWELRDWGQQVDKTGCWSTPPAFVGTRRDDLWEALSVHRLPLLEQLEDSRHTVPVGETEGHLPLVEPLQDMLF